jgi:hypothetical protein
VSRGKSENNEKQGKKAMRVNEGTRRNVSEAVKRTSFLSRW